MTRAAVTTLLLAVSGAALATGTDGGSPAWWQNPAILVPLFGIPGSIATYVLGTRKQAADTSVARDQLDMNAIAARDKAYADLLTGTRETQAQLVAMASENGAYRARVEIIETRQKEREERERVQITELAALKERVKRMDDCAGGHPCPLTTLRRA